MNLCHFQRPQVTLKGGMLLAQFTIRPRTSACMLIQFDSALPNFLGPLDMPALFDLE